MTVTYRETTFDQPDKQVVDVLAAAVGKEERRPYEGGPPLSEGVVSVLAVLGFPMISDKWANTTFEGRFAESSLRSTRRVTDSTSSECRSSRR